MKHFKNLSLLLLCTVMSLSFTACSKDDDENEIKKEQAKREILGSWSEVIDIGEGDYISGMLEIIWTFNYNNTASQQVIASLNDYVFKDVTNTYSYVYDGQSSITFTATNNKVWTYSIEVSGNTMRLGNEEDGYFNLTRKTGRK